MAGVQKRRGTDLRLSTGGIVAEESLTEAEKAFEHDGGPAVGLERGHGAGQCGGFDTVCAKPVGADAGTIQHNVVVHHQQDRRNGQPDRRLGEVDRRAHAAGAFCSWGCYRSP